MDDSRPWVAIDWSYSKGIHATFDGEEVLKFDDMDTFLRHPELSSPHRIAAESTIGSWGKSPDDKARLIEQIRSFGHEILVFRPLRTGRTRKDRGLEKSDEQDARLIYEFATQGRLHLHPVSTPDLEWVQNRERLNGTYNLLRKSGEIKTITELVTSLVNLRNLGSSVNEDLIKRVLSKNGKSVSLKVLLTTVAYATANTTSREEFERLLGLHGSAYPSLLRSNSYFHGYKNCRDRVTLSEFRRALRALRSLLIRAGVKPGSGTEGLLQSGAATTADRQEVPAEASQDHSSPTRLDPAATRPPRHCVNCGHEIVPTGRPGRPPVRCAECRTTTAS